MNKRQLIENLNDMELQLTNLISKLEGQTFNVQGTINCSGKGEHKRFYMYDGNSKTYLGNRNNDTVKDLAKKQYHDKLLNAARVEKGQIERCLKTLVSGRGTTDIDDVYSSLHKAVQELVTPYEETDDGYVEQWYKKNSRYSNNIKETNPALISARGESVKSKSEIIIADRLYHAGIPYVYELPVSFNGGMSIMYPDFFILNKRTRKEYFWEHQGKMDDSGYCKAAQLKLEEYAANGFILGKNLIFTYEGSSRALSTKYVDALIKEFLV